MATRWPPGPRSPSVVQAAQFGKDPYGYFMQCVERHGDIFTMRMPNERPRAVASRPEHVKKIFGLPADAFSHENQPFHLNLGDNALSFLDGERHRHERAIMMPPLLGDRMRGFAPLIARVTDEAIARWPVHEPFAMRASMQWLTLTVIIEAIFGVVEPERTEELRSLFMRWADGSLNSTMFILASLFTNSRLRRVLEGAVERRRRGPRPWPSLFFWQRLAELKLEIHAQLQREIDNCRQGGTEGRDDVLAMLVDSRYEDGSAMSNAQILDELVTMLVAGYETTATSLCWLFELLFAHPPVLERLREELSAACEGGFDPVEASAVPYLGACIREALRLRPIAPVITRTLTRPLDLDPYHFEAGDTVWANMIATQRRPDLWERPETFEPERWLTTPKRPSHHYFPWGGGRRRCIGMAFANYEMKVATARILMRATLRKVDPAVAEPAFRAAVIAPADGTRMILERPLE